MLPQLIQWFIIHQATTHQSSICFGIDLQKITKIFIIVTKRLTNFFDLCGKKRKYDYLSILQDFFFKLRVYQEPIVHVMSEKKKKEMKLIMDFEADHISQCV